MNPKVLKRGSVWALCLLLVIIRIPFFCSLYKRVEQVRLQSSASGNTDSFRCVPFCIGFREYGFLQVCTFPYSGNKQWITDNTQGKCSGHVIF